MEKKYTPGLWHAVPNNFYIDIKVMDEPYGQNLASTQLNEFIPIDAETQLANAKLIAAAPELLEALQAMLNTEIDPLIAYNQALDAIKKATL